MKAVVAGLALGLVAAVGGVANAAPGDLEGCYNIANPQNPPPATCAYVATRKGLYSNSGSWKLEIKRGCNKTATKCKQIIIINNPTTPGGFGYAAPGVIQPGDRVKGTVLAMGSELLFGNATGE